MYPSFDAKSTQSFASRSKRDGQHMIALPSLAANGFDIWWQKTFAQHNAMTVEANSLVRAHRLAISPNHARGSVAH